MPSARFILIVDNDCNLRETLALIIRRGGYNVIPLADVTKALHFLLKSPCDAAILDLNTGDEADVQAVAQLRSAHPDLPIVVLTGSPQFDISQFVQDYQIRSNLQKPVDPDLILGCVADLFVTT